MENWKERFRNQFVDIYGEKDSKEWRIAYQPIEELEDFISQELDKAREEKIQNIFTREECVIVEPRYISDWSDKYNKHFKCNRCKSKCLIPVIEPLVVICPKCGELDLDEIS